ncbi:MAG TPA: hypothetical protein VI385_17455 [Flavisolibacter sp.]
MNNLLTRHNFNQCEVCAYHESGHILFAYLCGYSCKEVQLINEGNENGFTSYALIDYGKDSYYASKFIGSDTSTEFFKCLALGEKLEAIEVGRRLARIFLGGSVAAAIFNNDGNVQIPLPMQIDYVDLLRVEFIHYVIKEVSIDQEEGFIEHGLQEALYTLTNVNIWDTVVDLAGRLLKANHLDKNDIEECLDEHGIIYDSETPFDATVDR